MVGGTAAPDRCPRSLRTTLGGHGPAAALRRCMFALGLRMTDSIPDSVQPATESVATGHRATRWWSDSPWLLRSLMLFAVSAFAFTASLPLLGRLGEATAPSLSFMTPMCLFFIANQLMCSQRPLRRSAVLGVYWQLAVAFAWAAADLWLGSRHHVASSPWLHHSRWRPLWTFGLPLLTLAFFQLPSVQRWMRHQNAA